MVTLLILLIIIAVTFRPSLKWYRKRKRYVDLINAIPGPKAYPVVGTAYIAFGATRKDQLRIKHESMARFPNMQRMWFGPIAHIKLKKAEHFEKILGSNKHHLLKSSMYKFIQPWLGDGLLIASGDKWRAHRKIITPTLHYSTFERFGEVIGKKTSILLKKFAEYCDTGVAIDICPHITRATLDIILEAAMGVEINAQNETENVYVKAVYEVTNLITHRINSLCLHPDMVYRRTEKGKRFQKVLHALHTNTLNVIKELKERLKIEAPSKEGQEISYREKGRQLAFLDHLLEHNNHEEHALSDEDIRMEVDTFMFAGHDTTTTMVLNGPFCYWPYILKSKKMPTLN